MKAFAFTAGLAGMVLASASAFASDGSLEARLAQVEQKLAASSAPSAREIQSSVDAYLASAQADATLVGGAGSAGYDGGFWIRGGSFLLKTNLTLQTRYEYFDWDLRADEPRPGGDLSGFSLPRVTLNLNSPDFTAATRLAASRSGGLPRAGRARRVERARAVEPADRWRWRSRPAAGRCRR